MSVEDLARAWLAEVRDALADDPGGHDAAVRIGARWDQDGWSKRFESALPTTDPRVLGGEIAGPGGPFDFGEVVLDMKNAVLLDSTDVCLVDPVREGERTGDEAIAILLHGRINKSDVRAKVMVLTNEDGAAAFLAELCALAYRGGFGERFMQRLRARLNALPTDPDADG